jgi:hypothetical protein
MWARNIIYMEDGTQWQTKVNQKIINRQVMRSNIITSCRISYVSRSADEANSQPCITQMFIIASQVTLQ